MGEWYYAVGEKPQGPVDEAEIRKLAPGTQIWREGMESWLPVDQVAAFAPESAVISAGPPPVPSEIASASLITKALPASTPPAGTVCAGCKSPNVVPGHHTPLCQSCRETLVKAPVPVWLRAAMIVIAVLMIYAATNLPKELRASIAYDRGESADASGNYKLAQQHYEDALAVYPDSYNIMARIVVSANRAGDHDTADKYFKVLAANAKTSDNAKMAELDAAKGIAFPEQAK